MQHDVINVYRWRSRQTFGERGIIIIHSTHIFHVIMQDNEHAFINQNKDGLPRKQELTSHSEFRKMPAVKLQQ